MIGLLAPLIGGTVILILLRRLVDSTENDVDNKILAAYEKSIDA